MNKLFFILFPCFCFFLFSCNKTSDYKETLPAARGAAGEIILVMDSANWKGALGKEIRNVFLAPIPGLPRDEPMYTLRYINPLALNDILRNAKNMIFVTILEGKSQANKKLKSYFTKESLEKIKGNPNIFMLTKQDEFAHGQEILHLFGETEQDLTENIKKNALQIRAYFDEVENKRLKKSVYAKHETGIEKAISKKYDFSIKVPYGWDIAKEKDDFIWLRELGRVTDKSVHISFKDYSSEGAFSRDSILNLRETIGKKYIFDSGDTGIYITTQRIAPVDTTVINFNGNYAIKIQGLWKLSDNSLGGPFVSYTMVDEKRNRLYYLEGFVSSPGNDKRNFVKELEVILSTFKIDK